MASYAIDLTERIILAALRNVVVQIVPPEVQVIRAQVNRVPEPTCDTYILLTRTRWEMIEYPTVTWDKDDPAPITLNMLSPVKASIQLDIHGQNGADLAWQLASTFKSYIACDMFNDLPQSSIEGEYTLPTGAVIQPLYSDSPKQAPFLNGEQQWEDRWMVEIALQANINIKVTEEFANALQIGLIDVDVVYPP